MKRRDRLGRGRRRYGAPVFPWAGACDRPSFSGRRFRLLARLLALTACSCVLAGPVRADDAPERDAAAAVAPLAARQETWRPAAPPRRLVTAADLLAARHLRPFVPAAAGPSALRTAADILAALGLGPAGAGKGGVVPGAPGPDDDDAAWDDGEDMGC
ncbi:MAG TPA: hypothetical protein ENJ73_01945 [Desulfobacterales bacterium]|nr:hypothetical protein [Desulfobacterales bacterium]